MVKWFLKLQGWHYITVEDRKNNLWAVSNPVMVTEHESEYKYYWGNIYSHTVICDGAGTLDWNYNYARDINMLDFACSTPHDVCWENMGIFGRHHWWNLEVG